jgi:hypothetical protein
MSGLNLKLYITKSLVTKMAVLLVLVASAYVLDIYLGNHPEEAQEIKAESQKQNEEQHSESYFVMQIAPASVNTVVQKLPTRKLQIQSHDKFLREFHSIRNYQVSQAQVATKTTPIISSYHYLVYQNHSFSPGEDPLA